MKGMKDELKSGKTPDQVKEVDSDQEIGSELTNSKDDNTRSGKP